jgi:hypothetical protein
LGREEIKRERGMRGMCICMYGSMFFPFKKRGAEGKKRLWIKSSSTNVCLLLMLRRSSKREQPCKNLIKEKQKREED